MTSPVSFRAVGFLVDIGDALWPGVSALPQMACAGFAGLMIRLALGSVGQRWVATYHHTMAYILLPVTAFAITRVIAGNISLSLGMIGALSIVRFRNPVRNPFELVVYFALVTVGVAMSAEPALGLVLGVFVVLVVYGAAVYERLARSRDRSPFVPSFTEGQACHSVVVRAGHRVEDLDHSEFMVQRLDDLDSNECSYVLNFRAREDLDAVLVILELPEIRAELRSVETRIGQSPS